MKSHSIASDKQRKLGKQPRDETAAGEQREDAPVSQANLMERIVERKNLYEALRQVEKNKGSPGIDGMRTDELRAYLVKHWLGIKELLLTGEYEPQPVLRVEIPKPDGGVRNLGVPTVLDRFIQQAVMQVLQNDWDSSFSKSSFGFRPNRSAHQAVAQAQEFIKQGYDHVVDIDLEKFFDRVNHDVLMQRVRERIQDWQALKLIASFLKAEVCVKQVKEPRTEGTPQGGPLSPLPSNLLLDDLDKELEKRGHRFARYADDCNIYVQSKRAAQRVYISIARFLNTRLKLRINESKSAVDRPWNRTFLGFTFTKNRPHRRKVNAKAIQRLQMRIRQITRRTRGYSMQKVIEELSKMLTGWKAYYSYSQVPSPLRDLDKWIRRRLRCYQWKQWGRRGYKELRKRGIDSFLAYNTSKSAHGPWRLSKSPALRRALPDKYFVQLGLPRLAEI